MKKLAACAFGAWGLLGGVALAAEGNLSCSAQFSLEEQVLLELAAFGGDPHAQMALAACSYPDNAQTSAAAMTSAQRVYAIRWNTLALCEAIPSPVHDRRDKRLRELKEDARISFRRFGGLEKGEKMNWRERDFMEYRKEQIALLAERHQRLMKDVTETDRAQARADLSDQLSRMGPVGLLKLAELSSCAAFGASEEFEAAAWSAASESWRGVEFSGVYAAAEDPDYDLPKVALEKTKKLTGADRRVAALEKERLLRTEPKRLADVEKKAGEYEQQVAVERIGDFALPVRVAAAGLGDAAPAAQPSLTTALQFALESLGYVAFVNGPDNDYGPTTRAGVARMTVATRGAPTEHLTNAEIRAAICEAALKNDPVSLYHVALMYQNGWGFPKNDAKAASAIRQSEMAMIAALGGESLPAWKREAYKAYAAKIRASAKELKKPEAGADDAICK